MSGKSVISHVVGLKEKTMTSDVIFMCDEPAIIDVLRVCSSVVRRIVGERRKTERRIIQKR